MKWTAGLWLVIAVSSICLLSASSASAAGQAERTLTISTESAEIWFNVGVAGATAPPPSVLTDAAGEHAAIVVAKEGACPASEHATQREIGLSDSTWCVHVSNLQAGYAVSGTVANPATKLTLTVSRKDGPAWAVVWSIVALIAAVVLSLLASTFVPRLTARLRLLLEPSTQRLRREPRDDAGIENLGEWVKMSKAIGLMDVNDLIARAQWARTYGCKQATKARGDLLAAVQAVTRADDLAGLRESKLFLDCEEEAGSKGFSREDLLTDAGERSIKAENLRSSLELAEKAIREFNLRTGILIQGLHDPAKKMQAQQARRGALGATRTLGQEGVPKFGETLDCIYEWMLEQGVAGANEPSPVPGLPERGSEPPEESAGDRDEARRHINHAPKNAQKGIMAAFAAVAPYFPSVLLAFVTMAGAVMVVFNAQYLANPNFGTPADYLGLILAGYGSAQVAAIATALLLMRSPQPWYG